MTTRDIVIQCEHGLHLRVASSVAGVAREHHGTTTTVQLTCGNCRKAKACSVLELLTLEASRGTHLEIIADGPDESCVMAALAKIFEDGDGI